jgi:hypothetical protein
MGSIKTSSTETHELRIETAESPICGCQQGIRSSRQRGSAVCMVCARTDPKGPVPVTSLVHFRGHQLPELRGRHVGNRSAPEISSSWTTHAGDAWPSQIAVRAHIVGQVEIWHVLSGEMRGTAGRRRRSLEAGREDRRFLCCHTEPRGCQPAMLRSIFHDMLSAQTWVRACAGFGCCFGRPKDGTVDSSQARGATAKSRRGVVAEKSSHHVALRGSQDNLDL